MTFNQLLFGSFYAESLLNPRLLYARRGAVKAGRSFPSLRIMGAPVLVLKDCENTLLGPAVIAP